VFGRIGFRKGDMQMKNGFRRSLSIGAAVLICSVLGFAGPTTATLDLTGVTGGQVGNVDTSPYIASINNSTVSTLVICDDFGTDSYLNDPLSFTVTNLASLSGSTPSTAVKFDDTNAAKQLADYETAAYLAEELLAINPDSAAGEAYSFAIWQVFDNSPVSQSAFTYLYNNTVNPTASGSLYNLAIADLTAAQKATKTASQFASVNIYTPNPKTASQEFLVVTMAEPPSLVVLGLYMVSLMGLVFVYRRRIIPGRRS
jgi:hypothetical protein